MGSLNYGYASVGGWRRISPKLYNEIPASDVRKGWFLNGEGACLPICLLQPKHILPGKGTCLYTSEVWGN